MPTRMRWGLVSIGVIVAAVLGFVYFFVIGYWQDSSSRMWRWIGQVFFERWLFPNGFNLFAATPLFYILAAIALAITTAYFWPRPKYETRESRYYGEERVKTDKMSGNKTAAVAAVVVALVSLGFMWVSFWNNDKDWARSYAGSTTFVVTDLENVPSSLASLAGGSTAANEDEAPCEVVGDADVFGCIAEGDMPDNWERRTASATGASIVMSRTSGSNQNTVLMTDTLSYLYDSDGQEGAWTAIRDGKNRQPLYGIVSWDGSGTSAKTCRFTGEYAINKAFDGRWGQNLHDEIVDQFPSLFFSKEDMWGYCRGTSGNEPQDPAVVIPVVEQEGFGQRTTTRPAGVLVITGSPSGEAQITHDTQIEPGEYPGPVYPVSLVAEQRGAIEWASGRADKNRLNFGYETTNVRSQAGNNSEYLLKSEDDGRLYWVTPLTPRGSDSELLVSYSVTRADAITPGSLNEQRVYVLNDEDARLVNLDDMQARVSQSIRESDPGFFTGDDPGRIAEFLPVDGVTWQAYAELEGRVVYRVDAPTNSRIEPTVYRLSSEADEGTLASTPEPSTGGEPSVEPASSDCGGDPAVMSKAQLAQCIAVWATELAGRPAD